jgi:hypothetical protein
MDIPITILIIWFLVGLVSVIVGAIEERIFEEHPLLSTGTFCETFFTLLIGSIGGALTFILVIDDLIFHIKKRNLKK